MYTTGTSMIDGCSAVRQRPDAAEVVIDLTRPHVVPSLQTRVLLVHEVRLFAEVMRVALSERAGFEVLQIVSAFDRAVRAARQARPDVVIIGIDSRLPDGFDVVRELRATCPETAVLVVADSADITSLTAAVAAGASGYLTMDAEMADLVETVRATAAGEAILSGRRLEAMIRHLGRQSTVAEGCQDLLTERERAVLARLIEGGSTKTIALDLCVSHNTARTHIQNVLSKLGVHSRLEAVALVARQQRA